MTPNVTSSASSVIAYYNGVTGERTALAAAELGGWTAATAALLTEGCGLAPGSRAGVLLPPHWQTAAVLLGAWSAGLQVSFRGWATAGLGPAGDPLDVTFVERRRVGSWLDEVPTATHQFVVGLAPAGAPTDDVPDGYRDYPREVRAHLGAPPPAGTAAAHEPATLDGTTFGAYGALAADIAQSHGFRRGDRLLIDAAASAEPLFWLLAPLTAGASIVLCADVDPGRRDEIAAAEQVTRIL